MSEKTYIALLTIAGLGFSLYFFATVVPAVTVDWDIWGAFAAGFVNPFAAGYSTDVIVCWLILAIWVVYEAQTLNIKHGWWCLLVGMVPGVAVGFAAYLIVRHKQLLLSSSQ